jgi:hypothetical protein
LAVADCGDDLVGEIGFVAGSRSWQPRFGEAARPGLLLTRGKKWPGTPRDKGART